MLTFEIEGSDHKGVERVHVRHAGGRAAVLRTLRDLLPEVERLDLLVRPDRKSGPQEEPGR
jgi:hypothetical protein